MQINSIGLPKSRNTHELQEVHKDWFPYDRYDR